MNFGTYTNASAMDRCHTVYSARLALYGDRVALKYRSDVCPIVRLKEDNWVCVHVCLWPG